MELCKFVVQDSGHVAAQLRAALTLLAEHEKCFHGIRILMSKPPSELVREGVRETCAEMLLASPPASRKF